METKSAVKDGNEVRMGTLKITSSKLGQIEYKDDDLITLSAPLLGFPELVDFLLIANDESYPFLWFQSAEDPDICFILVESCTFFKDYKPNISKRELKVLAVDDMEEELRIFCIVVVTNDLTKSTANLRAPLIVNFKKKLAKQVILDDDVWKIKTPLFP